MWEARQEALEEAAWQLDEAHGGGGSNSWTDFLKVQLTPTSAYTLPGEVGQER